MSHPVVLKASALIHAGDIVAAESALVDLVETEGDTALVTVLDQLAPKDLLAIIREYDSAKPSLVNLLVTPKQFAEAVIMERLYAERNRDRLRSLINSVVFREDVEPDDFIEALAQKDLGLRCPWGCGRTPDPQGRSRVPAARCRAGCRAGRGPRS